MITEEHGKQLKYERMEIAYNMIKLMQENDDLPVGNVYRLANIMQEYCIEEGVFDDLKAEGKTWRPSVGYWRRHTREITRHIRQEHGEYFGFVRDEGKLTGRWKFMTPDEWEYINKRDHSDIGTRIENHNEKLEDSVDIYELKMPYIQDVPLLN